MHICRVTRAFIPLRDGISHHAHYLSRHQVALGHQVWVLQPHHPTGKIEGVDIQQLPLGSLTPRYGNKSVTALFTLMAGWAAVRLHKRYGLDIIHGHGDIVEAFILKQFARKLGVPLTMTIHSGLSRQRYYRRVSPFVWRMINGLIAVSPDIARDMESLGVSSKRLSVLSSGVDLSRFTPVTAASRSAARAGLEIPETAFVITSVGRLTPMKGIRYLVEAIQRLTQTEDVQDVQCYIVGQGPLRAELDTMAASIPQLHFAGSQPHECIQSYLHASDIFVLPSIDRLGETEGTPTAVMEAMATGLPVISTDAGSAKHVMTAIEGLTIVPQHNSDALAEAIAKLAADAKARARIGTCNQQRVTSRDWPRIAAAVCQFYDEVRATT